MASAYVQRWRANRATGGSSSVTVSGATSGNLLIAIVTTTNASMSYTSPTGWSYLYSYNSGSVPRQRMFYRVADGTSSDDFSFTYGVSASAATLIIEVSGVVTSPVEIGRAANTNASSVTLTSSPSSDVVGRVFSFLQTDGGNPNEVTAGGWTTNITGENIGLASQAFTDDSSVSMTLGEGYGSQEVGLAFIFLEDSGGAPTTIDADVDAGASSVSVAVESGPVVTADVDAGFSSVSVSVASGPVFTASVDAGVSLVDVGLTVNGTVEFSASVEPGPASVSADVSQGISLAASVEAGLSQVAANVYRVQTFSANVESGLSDVSVTVTAAPANVVNIPAAVEAGAAQVSATLESEINVTANVQSGDSTVDVSVNMVIDIGNVAVEAGDGSVFAFISDGSYVPVADASVHGNEYADTRVLVRLST